MFRFFSIALIITLLAACSSESKQGERVTLKASDFTYTLSESIDGLELWTTPTTHILRAEEGPPDYKRSGLSLSAARNEFEPTQLILGPGRGEVKVTWSDFPSLGTQQRVEVSTLEFTDGWVRDFYPLSNGSRFELAEEHSSPLLITVYAPSDAPSGDHNTTLTIEHNGETVQVPLRLYVFDFQLPETGHFATQFYLNIADAFFAGGGLDDEYKWFFEHRMTPRRFLAPAPMSPFHNWDTAESSDPCEVFWDGWGEQYGTSSLSDQLRKYLLGEGWLGEGFPSALLSMYRSSEGPRPTELCGIEIGDVFGTEEYNAEWSQFLTATEQFMQGEGVLEKTYFAMIGGPQGQEDYDLAAHLCRMSREAAPNMKIAVIAEPKPEIAQHESGACGYDVWVAKATEYEKDYAWERQRDFGEEVWLSGPLQEFQGEGSEGMNYRVLPWMAWNLRVSGWVEYSTIRVGRDLSGEIVREGLEDYEYLYLANDLAGEGSPPQVFQEGAADGTARSVASSLTDWTDDVDAFMGLRHRLGLFIEGSLSEPPVLSDNAD